MTVQHQIARVYIHQDWCNTNFFHTRFVTLPSSSRCGAKKEPDMAGARAKWYLHFRLYKEGQLSSAAESVGQKQGTDEALHLLALNVCTNIDMLNMM